MRKLMEVYEAETGLIFKHEKRTYHLFYESVEEKTSSVRIANAKEAVEFMLDFFSDKLEANAERIFKVDEGREIINISLSLRGSEND